MVDFDGMKDEAEGFAKDHHDQVDQGLEKGADEAGDHLGHEEQIDAGEKKLEGMLGEDK